MRERDAFKAENKELQKQKYMTRTNEKSGIN
jgi:hypothetical protein